MVLILNSLDSISQRNLLSVAAMVRLVLADRAEAEATAVARVVPELRDKEATAVLAFIAPPVIRQVEEAGLVERVATQVVAVLPALVAQDLITT